MNEIARVRVGLDARSYDVMIGAGLLAAAGEAVAPLAPGGRVAIVTDEHVARLHLPALEASLAAAGLRADSVVLPPGEQTKSFAVLERLCEELLRLGLDRRDLIVAFGGGVIGDIAGFAAGILKRGLDFVQIPTTLLAQVDSSVGGKTAIDAKAGKNLIGLFHQPRMVLADLDLLTTLPERELKAGFAEIIKYGLIDEPDFFTWCERHAQDCLALDRAALGYAVERSVAAKARIVAADEREAGPRALLNFGHTFAHALEALAGMNGALLHGEAVAAGMAMALRFSAAQGLCPDEDARRAERLLAACGLPTEARSLPGAPFDLEAVLALMATDKKSQGGRITLILAEGIGRARVIKNTDENALRTFLKEELTLAAPWN